MRFATITSVVEGDNHMRFITANARICPGRRSLAIRGVTDSAAEDIRELVLESAGRAGLRLPAGAIAITLSFDVPFEATSELALAAFASLAEALRDRVPSKPAQLLA